MRMLITGGLLLAALLVDLRPGAAEIVYPWCARYDSSTRNCGFVSFNQCLATAQGTGAYCEENPRYNAPLMRGYRKARRAD
jgi:hypothetical protein